MRRDPGGRIIFMAATHKHTHTRPKTYLKIPFDKFIQVRWSLKHPDRLLIRAVDTVIGQQGGVD
jgi:hypothetical protein